MGESYFYFPRRPLVLRTSGPLSPKGGRLSGLTEMRTPRRWSGRFAFGTWNGIAILRLRNVPTPRDNVLGDNTTAQIAAMTPTLTGSPSAGYSGSVTVGLAV